MRVFKIPFENTCKGFCLFRDEATVDAWLLLVGVEIRVTGLRLALATVLQRNDVWDSEREKHILLGENFKYYVYGSYNTDKYSFELFGIPEVVVLMRPVAEELVRLFGWCSASYDTRPADLVETFVPCCAFSGSV